MDDSAARDHGDEIAIIGFAGRFPGARDAREFWRTLRDGVESVTEFTREEMIASGVDPGELDHPAYVSAGVPLEDADLFDAEFFGIKPAEAELMDPQHRIFLECAFAALEDAGYDPERHAHPIGVFGGVARNTYFTHHFHAYKRLMDAGGPYEAMLGFDKDYVATRVAYKLNLSGPAINVQSACSTSGVAVHLACQSLLNGECDMALAGGARIRVPLRAGYIYVEGGVPSPDGHCRAFDADAAGCVFGSGAAILVLKRLADAIRDGDAIRAVIKGTAINNDGSAKVGFTAPGVQGQAAVIEEALAIAGVSADAIGYVETHGTGTTLGDPIEINALTRAFRKTTDRVGYCPIGSVKTNIGHLDAGAAAAGVIKTVLAMEHEAIPPSLNYRRPNPQIDFANSPFFVNAELRPWPRTDRPRLAGVSSFGLGGTNVHIVLQEAPAPSQGSATRPRQLLLLSARSASALEAATAELASHLEAHPDADMADVAYTLQVGRKRFDHRRAIVCESRDDAVAALRSGAGRNVQTHVDASADRPVVFMFPGGGAQYPNMGWDLYRHEPVYRAHVDECLDLLADQLDVDLRDYLYPGPDGAERVAQALERPSLALPTLMITEFALARLWQSWGIQPAAVIGHSLGEYTAACVSGVMSLRDALSLASLRGRLFERLSGGGMLAVPLAESALEPLLVDGLDIAAINTPSHCVVSGPTNDLQRMKQVLEEAGVEYTPLHISVAAHSAMVEPILDEFGAFLRTLRFDAPRIPLVSNVTGTWITAEQAADPEYWVAHLRGTVRFSEGLGVLLQDPSLAFVEVGPGQTLSIFTRQHPARAANSVVVSSIRHPKERASDVGFLLGGLGRLWAAGANVDWQGFYAREPRRRVSLPTYPYERKRYWLAPVGSGAPAAIDPAPAGGSGMIETTRESDHARGAVDAADRGGGSGAPQGFDRKGAVASRLKQVLHELSGVDVAGLDAHATFLELGFDSLFLTRANIEFQKRFGVKITFRQLFDEAPTLDALAAFIASRLPPDFFGDDVAPATGKTAAAATAPDAADGPDDWEAGGRVPARVAARRAAAESAPVAPDTVERLIAQQLRVMEQQLAVLRGGSPVAGPLDELAGAGRGAVDGRPAAAPAVRIESRAAAETTAAAVVPTWRQHGPWKPLSGAVGDLTDHQREHLEDLIERYTRRTRRSKELAAGQRSHLADPRSITGFHRLWKEMVYQIAMADASGGRMTDIDGNEYVDLTMGFGINLFGHAPDFVADAIRAQLDRGIELGVLTPLARDVADRLCRLTGMERATFVNTGSEAVAAAVRAARTATARDRIAVFDGDYHGIGEELLVAGVPTGGERIPTPVAPGIPSSLVQNVLVLDYEDPTCVDRILAEADRLAAVIVEPVPSRRPDFRPADVLAAVREATAANGIALIFDEIMTGFRLHPRGAQGMYGITADIAAYGKVLSGGLPMAAVAGKAEFLDAFDGGAWSYGDDSFPEARVTFFGGTFVRHPLSLAASLAVLDHLERSGPELQERLNERAGEFAERLNGLFAREAAPLRLAHCGSMLHLSFETEDPLARLIFYYLRERGVHLWDRPAFLSTAHSPEDLDFVYGAFEASLAEMQAASFIDAPAARRDDGPAPPEPRGEPVKAAMAGADRAVRKSEARERERAVPLTDSQLEIWLATRFGEDASRAYHLSFSVELVGTLDAGALARAVQGVVDRHEALRTTIAADGSVQRISPVAEVDLAVVDLAELDGDAAVRHIDELLGGELDRPFDLTAGPLLRVRLVRLAEDRHRLILVAHHIVCDAVSLGIIARELGALYRRERGGSADLGEPIRFSDYATRLAAARDSAERHESEAYWVRQFAGGVPVLELPTDRPRPPLKTYDAAQERITLAEPVYTALKRAAASHNCTPFAALLAAYKVLLCRLTKQEDLVVGIASAGQSVHGDELVGHCVNTLPIRSQPRGEAAFSDYLAAVRGKVLDAFEHGDVTYGAILQKLRVRRDASRPPLVSVMFNLDPQVRRIDFGELRAAVAFNPKRFENFDLFLNVVESGGTATLEWTYNTDLFEASTIRRWLGHLATLIGAAAADPGARISELSLLDDADRRRLLVEWNDTVTEVPAGASVQDLFAAAAGAVPEAIALEHGGRSWTYAELDRESNRLAHYFAAQGVGPGSPPVGLCLERSADMVVALLGVLKAGGSYLPLDPEFPSERLRFMVQDAGAEVLVSQSSLAQLLPDGARAVFLDRDGGPISRHSDAQPEVRIDPEDLAYLIYTSGSTGKPKGVEVPHRAVVNFLTSMAREPGLAADDVLVAVTTLSFDISVLELLLPLTVGARVVVASREEAGDGRALMELIEASGATAMQATPATWRLLLDAGWQGRPGLKVLCGGEALPRELADRLVERAGEVWNMYGPTETTVWSTCWRVDAGAGAVPIGRPIANTRVYVLDEMAQPAPVGITGELYIGGAGVARGYWRRPELTAERFVPDPFGSDASARLYRTGDLVRYREDGVLEFVGRADNQVKVRGFRIEPGEIEEVLAEHLAVRQAVVTVREDRPGDARLVAYVVARQGQAVTTSELRRHLRVRLPEYMIPQHFVELDELPLTPNGKVDRRALPAPFTGVVDASNGKVAPRSEREQLVARIWEEVLATESVGIHDNFFDLGGHSLLSMQVIARIEKETGHRLNPRAMILQTLEQIAFEIESQAGAAGPEPASDGAAEQPGIARRVVDVLKKSFSSS